MSEQTLTIETPETAAPEVAVTEAVEVTPALILPTIKANAPIDEKLEQALALYNFATDNREARAQADKDALQVFASHLVRTKLTEDEQTVVRKLYQFPTYNSSRNEAGSVSKNEELGQTFRYTRERASLLLEIARLLGLAPVQKNDKYAYPLPESTRKQYKVLFAGAEKDIARALRVYAAIQRRLINDFEKDPALVTKEFTKLPPAKQTVVRRNYVKARVAEIVALFGDVTQEAFAKDKPALRAFVARQERAAGQLPEIEAAYDRNPQAFASATVSA